MEQVNHPKHYNQHPAGIECIDIIRHYTCDIANALKYLWRAGLKPEMGKKDAEKEIEDLAKALWYINDYVTNCQKETLTTAPRKKFKQLVSGATGYSISQICKGYEDNIAKAMELLLCVGLIKAGGSIRVEYWEKFLESATTCIQKRILDINQQLIDKDVSDIGKMLRGVAVEGEDYVAKPGGEREDEPDHYDPLNMMIVFGRAYALDDKVRKKDNGAVYPPCEVCDLRNECVSKDGTESMKFLCLLHGASDNEYYQEVGYCRYSPHFGTIEVVDEHKELEIEIKKMEEENQEL